MAKFETMRDIHENGKPLEQKVLSQLGSEKKYPIYKVDISLLKFNKYNDRFAMEASSNDFPKNEDEIQEKIQYILINQDIHRNKITLEDIKKKGIIKDIVVNLDGIILDGNRRVAILRKWLNESQFKEIKVVLIPEEHTKEEIHEIETKLQISEDEKVDYDTINIYLKINRLFNEQTPSQNKEQKINKISELMGSKYPVSIINEKIEIFKTMEEYLNFIHKPGQWMYLREREDHLKQITTFEKNLRNDSIKTEEGSNVDFSEDITLQSKAINILFGFTSLLVEGKTFREIIPTNKKNKITALTSEDAIKFYEEIYNKYKYHIDKQPSSKLENSEDNRFQKEIAGVQMRLENMKGDVSLKQAIDDTYYKIENLYDKYHESTITTNDCDNFLATLYKTHETLKKIIKDLENKKKDK